MNKDKGNNIQIIGISEGKEKGKEEKQVVGETISRELSQSLEKGSCTNTRG